MKLAGDDKNGRKYFLWKPGSDFLAFIATACCEDRQQ